MFKMHPRQIIKARNNESQLYHGKQNEQQNNNNNNNVTVIIILMESNLAIYEKVGLISDFFTEREKNLAAS